MTLRMRLLWSMTFALLAGAVLGCALTFWQARQSISTELHAALAVGRQTVASELDAIAAASDREAELRRMVSDFDGNRHIWASLIGSDGARLASSSVAPTEAAAPHWFGWTIGAERTEIEIPIPVVVPGIRGIRLETDPRNELGEIWRSFGDTMVAIVALSALASLLIWWGITRALRPLAEFSAALRSVGEGRFDARLSAGGIPEIRPIAEAFNRMAADLATARQRNLALYRRLLTAQEAERAEIARDLHDDIGPLLFAINIDTAAGERAAGAGDAAEAQRSAQAVRETVQQMQVRVRGIVDRLRPVGLAELGLGRAIESLAGFWRRLQPAVEFRLDLPDDIEVGGSCSITAYRIVQEAVSNALRHARPGIVSVAIHVEGDPPGVLVVRIADDGDGAAPIEPGFGLLGMEERVRAAGGELDVTLVPGSGVTVTARLPVADADTRAATPLAEAAS